MTLETLLLLRQVLTAQQMSVGSEDFRTAAKAVMTALDELDAAIKEAENSLV